MNTVQTFNNNLFGAVRAIKVEEQVWFFGRDVVEDLDYDLNGNSYTKYIKRFCDEEDTLKLNNSDLDLFGIEDVGRKGETLINEYAVIDLVLQSPLPQAKQFKRWITHEVIPSVLETGSYGTPKLTERDSAILAVMNSKNDVEFVGALKNFENVITKPLLNTIEEQQDTIEEQDAKIEELDIEVNTLLDISDLPLDTIRSRIFEFMRPRHESYGALYSEFDLRYHIRSGIQFANYKKDYLERWERGEVKKKDMINSQLKYICDELEMAEELYLVMADVFSTDFIYFLKTKLDDFEY